MVHQESTGCGGREVVPGDMLGGSWKAGWEGAMGSKSGRSETSRCWRAAKSLGQDERISWGYGSSNI